MRGLYRGLLPSVLAMLPEAAITYGAPLLRLPFRLRCGRCVASFPEDS